MLNDGVHEKAAISGKDEVVICDGGEIFWDQGGEFQSLRFGEYGNG